MAALAPTTRGKWVVDLICLPVCLSVCCCLSDVVVCLSVSPSPFPFIASQVRVVGSCGAGGRVHSVARARNPPAREVKLLPLTLQALHFLPISSPFPPYFH